MMYPATTARKSMPQVASTVWCYLPVVSLHLLHCWVLGFAAHHGLCCHLSVCFPHASVQHNPTDYKRSHNQHHALQGIEVSPLTPHTHV